MNKPYIIGITGGIGCGKTTATDYLAEQGYVVADADVESRALTAEGGDALPKIREKFGDAVFDENGALNRAALSELVFADREKRLVLEGIIHPMVQRRMLNRVREAGEQNARVVFLSVPLLFETGMDALCDETWCLVVPREEQIKRVMTRDNLTREQAQSRIDSQMPLDEKARLATVTIRTNRAIESTRSDINSLLRDLRRRIG